MAAAVRKKMQFFFEKGKDARCEHAIIPTFTNARPSPGDGARVADAGLWVQAVPLYILYPAWGVWEEGLNSAVPGGVRTWTDFFLKKKKRRAVSWIMADNPTHGGGEGADSGSDWDVVIHHSVEGYAGMTNMVAVATRPGVSADDEDLSGSRLFVFF